MRVLRKCSSNKNIHNNAGSTMTEVLVGFVLLMILVATLINIVKVSQNMIMNSVDYISRRESFAQERYRKDAVYEEVSGLTFTLQIDSANTSPLNQASPLDMPVSISVGEYQSTTDMNMSIYRFMNK